MKYYKNKKRINPRYFLEETATRDNEIDTLAEAENLKEYFKVSADVAKLVCTSCPSTPTGAKPLIELKRGTKVEDLKHAAERNGHEYRLVRLSPSYEGYVYGGYLERIGLDTAQQVAVLGWEAGEEVVGELADMELDDVISLIKDLDYKKLKNMGLDTLKKMHKFLSKALEKYPGVRRGLELAGEDAERLLEWITEIIKEKEERENK